MNSDPALIAQVASRYSIPPAILAATIEHRQGDAVLSPALLTAYDLSPKDVEGNAELVATIAAQQLSQNYRQSGNWESAISTLVAGDPQAWQSPTSPVGGTVYSILGTAAADPTFGMAELRPVNAELYLSGAKGFSDHLAEIHDAGGVVSRQTVTTYRQAVRQTPVSNGAGEFVAATSFRPDALPFDPKFDKVTQGFMPGAGAFEPGHTGVDYAVADRSPLYAVKGGRIEIQQGSWGPGGNAVSVVAPDGTRYLYGHVSAFTVQNGATVQPGQQIALSGGAGEAGSGFSTGAHLHFEVRDASGALVNPDPAVQAAFERQHGLAPDQAAPSAQQQAAQQQATQGRLSSTETMIAAAEMGLHSPKEVSEFAAQLQAAGVDPTWFAQNYPSIAATRRRLLQKSTGVADVVPMNGMDPSAQLAYIRAQPHPTYPEHAAGAFNDMYNTASLHSVPNLGRTPYPAEVARLMGANAGWSELKDFYAPRKPQPTPAAPAPPPGPADLQPTERRTASTRTF